METEVMILRQLSNSRTSVNTITTYLWGQADHPDHQYEVPRIMGPALEFLPLGLTQVYMWKMPSELPQLTFQPKIRSIKSFLSWLVNDLSSAVSDLHRLTGYNFDFVPLICII